MEVKPDILARGLYETDSVARFYVTHEYSFPAEQVILDKLGPRIGQMKVLDIGIGGGRTTEYLSKLCKDYTGIDFSEQMVRESKKRFSDLKIWQGDVRDLSAFEEESFDFVLFSFNGIDTLVHTDRIKSLQEIKRVLKPGGAFAFSSHNRGWSRFDRPFPWQQKFEFNINFIKHYVKVLLHLPRIMAKRKKNFYAEDYALIVDGTHFFSLYNYYIKPAGQAKQLNENGFENVLCLNVNGNEISENNTTEFLYYFCRKHQ